MDCPPRLTRSPDSAYVYEAWERNSSGASPAEISTVPKIRPFPGSNPASAQVPARRGARIEADHADHSGVSSGKVSERWSIASSTGWGPSPPRWNPWKSTSGYRPRCVAIRSSHSSRVRRWVMTRPMLWHWMQVFSTSRSAS